MQRLFLEDTKFIAKLDAAWNLQAIDVDKLVMGIMNNQSVPAQPFLNPNSFYGMGGFRPVAEHLLPARSPGNANSFCHFGDHDLPPWWRLCAPVLAAVLANWFMNLSLNIETQLDRWNERLEDEYEARQRLKNGASTESPGTTVPDASSSAEVSEKPTAVPDAAKVSEKSAAILHTISPIFSPALQQTLRRRNALSEEDRKLKERKEEIGRRSSIM